MRHLDVMRALIVVTEMRFEQTQIDDGNLFVSKTTFIIDGFVKPAWWVATPIHVQPRGVSRAAICLDDVKTLDDCPPHHLARAGISALPWKGGNMPDSKAFEQKLYHWEDTQSGFTVLTLAIVSGLLVFAGAYAVAGELAGSASSIASVGTAGASTSAMGNAALAGVVGTSTYLGATDIMHPRSILDQPLRPTGCQPSLLNCY